MIIREDLVEARIIIGCTRDSQIHTGATAFSLMASGLYDKLISRAEAKFMAACDVGEAWKQLLEQPAIFGLDEYGTPCFVKGGLAQPKPVGEVVAQESAAVAEHSVAPKKAKKKRK